jgi:hypothetical protein
MRERAANPDTATDNDADAGADAAAVYGGVAQP